MTLDFDAYQPKGQRAGNIRVNGKPLDLTAPYTYASYWYAGDEPDQRRAGQDIVLLKDNEGKPMDGTEVVVQYLESLPERTADTRGRQHEAGRALRDAEAFRPCCCSGKTKWSRFHNSKSEPWVRTFINEFTGIDIVARSSLVVASNIRYSSYNPPHL